VNQPRGLPLKIIGSVLFLGALLIGGILPVHAEAQEPVIRAERVQCILQELHLGRPAFRVEDAIDPTLINYKIYGEGHPETVVLIHGLAGDLSTWNDIAPKLAEKYRVLVYDQRGHGKTPAPNENFSSTAMATDLNGLLDYLHIDHAHILGHSMGGRTAIRFASLFPEKTVSVIVEDMHMRGRANLQKSPYDLTQQLKLLDGKTFADRKAAVDFAQHLMGPLPKEDIDWYEPMEDPESHLWRFNKAKSVFALYEIEGYQEDLTPALRSIRAPKFFLAADPTKYVFLSGLGIQHLRENSPDAQLVVVPGSDHSIHRTQFNAFVSHVEDFLAGNSAYAIARPGFDVVAMNKAYEGEAEGKVPGYRTRYLSPEERAHSRITIRNGLLYDADGKLLDTSNGIVHRPDGKIEGRSIFVMDGEGNFYWAEKTDGTIYHSSFLGGGPIAAGGEFQVRQGKVIYMNDRSGHYFQNLAPPGSGQKSSDHYLQQAVRSLENQGVGLKRQEPPIQVDPVVVLPNQVAPRFHEDMFVDF
jgi:esterase